MKRANTPKRAPFSLPTRSFLMLKGLQFLIHHKLLPFLFSKYSKNSAIITHTHKQKREKQ